MTGEPNMTRTTSAIIAALTLLATLGAPRTADAAATAAPDPSIATFEGGKIDLRSGWGDAKACTSDGATTACFRSEAELDEAWPGRASSPGFVISSVCSASLKLYSATSYGGTLLQLSARLTYINLSVYGFDNTTSSYKIGPCSATFYDGSNGGAPSYPGNTTANFQSLSMSVGWDNRVSSIYIS